MDQDRRLSVSPTSTGLLVVLLVVVLSVSVLALASQTEDASAATRWQNTALYCGSNVDLDTSFISDASGAADPYLVYHADLSGIAPGNRAEVMGEVKGVVEKRVKAFGLAEHIITVQEHDGEWSIAIQLSGVTDIETVKRMVFLSAVLEFREWDDAEQRWIPATGTVTVDGEQRDLALSSRYFKEETFVVVDERTRNPLLVFEWDEIGQQLSQQVTGRLIGKQMAIYLGNDPLLDAQGRPIAPVIQDVISEGGQISGLNLATAEMLSRFFNAGRLPVPLGRWVGEGQSKAFEPDVPFYEGQMTSVTVTLHIHEDINDGLPVAGIRVTGRDGARNSINETTNADGYVIITGVLGTWSLKASKAGYETKSWSPLITSTETMDAYLIRRAEREGLPASGWAMIGIGVSVLAGMILWRRWSAKAEPSG